MAEVKPTASAAQATAERRSGTGFELRLERGGAYVCLTDTKVVPGLVLGQLSIEIPGVRFPFNVGAGAVQFRHVLADLVRVELAAQQAWLSEALARVDAAALGFEALSCTPREGFLELAGRLAGGAAFTLHAGLLPEGEQGIAVRFHSPRLYGPSPIPAAVLPHLAERILAPIARAPGGPGDPLPRLLRRVLAPRGWKVPRAAAVRLSALAVGPEGIRAAWDRDPASPVELPPVADLLASLEGARAFAAAEARLAQGDVDAAREAYLAAGAEAHAHPFAAERLLSLLVLEERFHDEALDLAHDWLSRRPDFAPALCAEAWVRLARREAARAARALATLAATARARGEGGSALAAAEACFGVQGAEPDDLRRAIEAALAIRRDHLPSLRALRALSHATGDREGLLRANRRLVAYASADADKARAHAELGTLLLEADPPAARLHLDQAIRLAPDDEEALRALIRACTAAGEHLRAVRAIERLREQLLARGDRAAAGRLSLEAGVLWEERLASDENAWLRYAEAAEALPDSPEVHARAAGAAERLGRWADASDHHAAVLSLVDDSTAEGRALLGRTRLALAAVAEEKLGDAAAAAFHLQAAVAHADDPALLQRLVALYRRLDRPGELLAAIDRLAPRVEAAKERAALLAEAGALAAGLGQADAARGRFSAAAALDPLCRVALEGMARLAKAAGDALGEREALARLLPLAAGAEEEAELQDRIADAAERAGDLAGASRAAAAARRAAPSAARLDASLRLARRAGDGAEVAALLGERARRLVAEGASAEAARAWLERAQLLSERDPTLALAAAGEAHALAPGDPAVLRAQADLAERLGDARAALGSLRALLATRPDDAGPLEVRAGRAALAAAEPSAARDHAQRAMAAAAPGAADLLAAVLDLTGDDAGRADLLERLGRHLDAAELWARKRDSARERQALERAALEPGIPSPALERLAELRLDAAEPRGAAELLRRLAPLRGGRAGAALAMRAWSLDADPAALDAAIACDPTSAPARAERALQLADRDPHLALSDCDVALESAALPTDRRAALLRLAARLAEAGGDAPRARAHLAQLAGLDDDPATLAELARLQRTAGDPGLAATLERLLPHLTGSEAAALRVELAALLAATPEREVEALTLLRAALETREGEPLALRALLAPPLDRRLPPDERLMLLGRFADHPDTPPAEAAAAHRERAARLAGAGQLLPALDAARAAARAAPEPDEALELRARLAEAAGDREEAAEALLRRARRLVEAGDPDAGTRLAEAGLAAVAAGRPEPGEAALRAALSMQLDRELAGPALAALAAGARERGDAAAELDALSRLVSHLPTGERPPALLRLANLLHAAQRLEEARGAAREARILAPRDPAAIELCRSLAQEAGDLSDVVDRLAALAALDPASAPARQVERARLLVALARPVEADDAFTEALAGLPAELALAREQVRLRRAAPELAERPAAEPLERCAARLGDRRASAAVFREAVALATLAGDAGVALRSARRAWARSRGEDLAFAGPLLARLLFLQGSRAEALVVHRALFDAGLPGVDPAEAITLCRQLAELAEDEGDVPLALSALERALTARPQDRDAALQRFRLDPDREAACRALAAAADSLRSDAQRVDLLQRAARGALLEVGDRDLAERWFRAARGDAARVSRLALAVERARADAVRAAELGPSALLEALHDAAATALAVGERSQARDLLEEAVEEERLRGMRRECARDLLALADLDAEDGFAAGAALRALTAGELLEEAGNLYGAAQALQRASREDPSSDAVASRLERVARALGEAGAPLLSEALALRAELAPPGPERAAALAHVAEPLLDTDPAQAAALLERARAEAPGAEAPERLLEEAWRRLGRTADVATLILERAGRAESAADRARLRRVAAGMLSGSADEGDRARAAEAWEAVFAADPSDLGAARAAADLLRALGRREEALPLLAALVRADPDDEESAAELADAFAGRHRERGELFLARAEAATGEPRAHRLREAARALFAAGDDQRGRRLLRDAFDAWPADDNAFFGAIRDAAADIERLDEVLSARARAVPAEAMGCHRARADALLAFGRTEQALAAWEACAAASGGDVEVLASWADCLDQVRGHEEAAEIDGRILMLAASSAGVPGAIEGPSRYRLGLAAWAAGREAEAATHLERAIACAPEDRRAGPAFAVLARTRRAAGDPEGAIAAARGRAVRAVDPDERRAAVEEGVALVDELGVQGEDAAALLELGADLIAERGLPPEEAVAIARRAAAALEGTGAAERARALRARHHLPEEPPAEPAPAVDLEALRARFEAGPAAEGWAAAAAALADAHRARGEFRDAVVIEAQLGDAATDPAERAGAWIRAAEALEKAGAAPDEVDAAIDIAAEADPDSSAPWLALAALQDRRGDAIAAARAHLSVAIRAEGDVAARSALEAARLFKQAGRHEDAARSYRAAIHASPGCVPARRVLAEEALAAGDVHGAADHLLAVALEEVPPDDRLEHRRTLARILESAGRDEESMGEWRGLFREAPGDGEAFEHLGRLTLAGAGIDAWLELAAEHEAALALRSDSERRRDLRHRRGALFATAGRLEAARGAFLAALELDPGHLTSVESLASLDDRREEWRSAAEGLAAEAAQATDGAEAAAILVRRARILQERLGDAEAAVAALDEALVRARLSDGPAAERSAVEAEELLTMIGPARAAANPPEATASAGPAPDPVAVVLRAQAEAEQGTARAALLERLAGHLERSGEAAAAADALLDALEADPERELTWSWLLALSEGDTARLERAAAIRARAGLEPMVASPEVRAIPELEIPEPAEPLAAEPPDEQRPIAHLDLEEPEPSFRFEAGPTEQEIADAIRFEPGEGPGGGPGGDFLAPPVGAMGDLEPAPGPDGFAPSVGEWEAPPPEEGSGLLPPEADLPAPPPPTPGEIAPPPAEEAAPPPPPEPPPVVPPPPTSPADRVAAARATLVSRWDAPPREQCALRRELGMALAEVGELDEAIGALLGASAADPADLETLESLALLHEQAGRHLEALSWHERAADLLEAGPARAVRLAELARDAERLGDRDRAVWLWERVRAADHRYRSALEALCRLYAGAGDRVQLRLVAAELSDVAGDGALEPWAAALGRAWMEAGKPEVAYAWLQRALRTDPSDMTIARDLSRIAERIGSWGEYVRLGEVCADAFAAYDPMAAATRFRHFAEVLRDRLSDTERAAVMLEKTLSLTPDDADARRELLALWSARPETAQRALDGWLDAARLDPADGLALVSLSETCRAIARELAPGDDALLLERARIAASLAAFLNPALATAPPLKLASAVPEELRDRVAVPGATGSLARLLALLSPYLEPLFPADLARRGASPGDRLVPPRAPELRTAVEGAAHAFGARPHAVFLTARASAEVTIENTQPPAIVAGADLAGMAEGALAFLAARTFDLLGRGWALAGKFAPRDVAILMELACRFIDAPVPTSGLPAQRAEAFLGALGRTVPPAVRERALQLAPAAAKEIATFEPRRFAAAVRRTANRVALLYTGDPGAALRALAAAERKAEQPELDPVEALALPDLRDLALFALSDPFLELRVSVTL